MNENQWRRTSKKFNKWMKTDVLTWMNENQIWMNENQTWMNENQWWMNAFSSFQAVRVANKPKVRGGGGSLLITLQALLLFSKLRFKPSSCFQSWDSSPPPVFKVKIPALLFSKLRFKPSSCFFSSKVRSKPSCLSKLSFKPAWFSKWDSTPEYFPKMRFEPSCF